MLIDFHTHIFPEKIAARTLDVLVDGVRREQGEEYVRTHTLKFSDGTRSGLLRQMHENGVDRSVCLPIVTKPSQTESINRYAEGIRSARLLSFGSLYPTQPDWESVLENLAERGFRGIKLHPQFQQSYIDSPETLRILKKAQSLGMLVVFHAGIDIGLPEPVFATPARIRNVLTEMDGSTLIAAHLGGWRQWDAVEHALVGTSINLDTAFIQGFLPVEQCRRIIEQHGAEKILFATDSPWESAQDTLAYLHSLGLSSDAMEQICWRNAMRLLGEGAFTEPCVLEKT